MTRREREERRLQRVHDALNAHLLAEHANMRAQILALRPDWDPVKLEEVRHTWGELRGLIGLHDLLRIVQQAADLDARFKK